MSSSLRIKSKKQKIIVGCLIASFGIHVGTLFLFYTHPVFIYPYLGSILAKAIPSKLLNPDLEELEEIAHSEQLEDFFNEPVSLDQIPYDLARLPIKETGFPHEETAQGLGSLFGEEEIKTPTLPEEWTTAPEFSLPSLSSAPLIPPETEVPFLSSAIELDKSSQIEFLDGILKARELVETKDADDILAANEKIMEFHFTPEHCIGLLKNSGSLAKLDPDAAPQLKIADDSFLVLEEKETNLRQDPSPPSDLFLPMPVQPYEPSERRALLKGALSSAQDYGLPEEDAPIEWNKDFDVQVAVMPDEETGKFIFSATLIPNFDQTAEKMKQNFIFLIDRSNSIEKHKFSVFKRAALKALHSMKGDDSFNIYILDRKIIKFSDKSLPISKKTLQLAEDFLNKEEQNNFFSVTDLNTALEKTFPSSLFSEEDVTTALLITDGKTLLKPIKQQRALSQWLKRNKGKVTLFTATAGQDNDLFLLDLLSTLSGGQLLYSDTHASFPRKLAKLILDLQQPIAKEIAISAIPLEGKPEIVFYPSSLPFSPLYNRKPFTIVGTIDKLLDFTLVVQGRNEEQLFTIKKEITFQGVKKGGTALEKNWAVQQANILYEDFLYEGKTSYLKKAKKILTPHSSFVAKK